MQRIIRINIGSVLDNAPYLAHFYAAYNKKYFIYIYSRDERNKQNLLSTQCAMISEILFGVPHLIYV